MGNLKDVNKKIWKLNSIPIKAASGFIDAAVHYDPDFFRGINRLARHDFPNYDRWRGIIENPIIGPGLFTYGQIAIRTIGGLLLADLAMLEAVGLGVTIGHPVETTSYPIMFAASTAVGLVFGATSYAAKAGRMERREKKGQK